MKGLQFFGNRVEDAANAFIDVLKYSDQSVTYPDFKDIAKRLGVSVGTIGRVINKKSYRDENIDRKR